MQAITTHFCPPTNNLPPRITARCQAGRVTVAHPVQKSEQAAHRVAAEALAAKLNWVGPHYGPLVGGEIPGGYVFVFLDDQAGE